MWLLLTGKLKQANADLSFRIKAIRPGHVAGLFFVMLALMVYDDNGAGVVGFIERHGLEPRLGGIVVAFCGAFLLSSPRSFLAPLATSPFLFYVMMSFLYFLGRSPGEQTFIPPLLYLALYFFMTFTLVQDGNAWRLEQKPH